MVARRGTGPPGLELKKHLLVHSYDAFLIAQTRIFTLAHSVYSRASGEIETRQKFLFLDDIISFAINGRRLIQLTVQGPFANKQHIPLQHFDTREKPIRIAPLGEQVGFLTFLNGLIHNKHLDLFTNQLDVDPPPASSDKDLVQLYLLAEKLRREDRWSDYSIPPSIILETDRGAVMMVTLRDVVTCSVVVMEKVADVCGESGIFLELDYRGMD
jgi:hypothetical protein